MPKNRYKTDSQSHSLLQNVFKLDIRKSTLKKIKRTKSHHEEGGNIPKIII
jgi:hypothetical protein